MVLTKAGGNPLAVDGPGEIWQNEEGVLQFKIFINRDACRSLQTYMARPGVIGQLIPDEDYFALEAQEYCLPLWTAQGVLPTPRSGPVGGFAHGYLNELVHTDAHPPNRQSDFVTLRFRGKLNFPCNQGTETVIRVGGQDRHTSSSLNVAFIDDGEYRFELLHEREHTVVSLQLPAGRLTPSTPSRIHEALQFALGQQLALMVIETVVGGQHVTRLTSPSRGHGEMSPPLQFQRWDEGGHVWRMFTNYFRHVHANAEAGWHPISRHVGSAIESTAASLEAMVLALAVAVEGLAYDCFPGIAPVSPDFLAELDAAQAALLAVALGEQNRNRINSSLNAMRAPRNSDVLRAFIANNRLPQGLYTSWSRLRNASTHGCGAGGRDIATTHRLKSEVLSLLYSLVFAAINYTGPRTDYSLPGWPTRAWPIPQPPAAAPAPAPPQSPAAAPGPASAPVPMAQQVSAPETPRAQTIALQLQTVTPAPPSPANAAPAAAPIPAVAAPLPNPPVPVVAPQPQTPPGTQPPAAIPAA